MLLLSLHPMAKGSAAYKYSRLVTKAYLVVSNRNVNKLGVDRQDLGVSCGLSLPRVLEHFIICMSSLADGRQITEYWSRLYTEQESSYCPRIYFPAAILATSAAKSSVRFSIPSPTSIRAKPIILAPFSSDSLPTVLSLVFT